MECNKLALATKCTCFPRSRTEVFYNHSEVVKGKSWLLVVIKPIFVGREVSYVKCCRMKYCNMIGLQSRLVLLIFLCQGRLVNLLDVKLLKSEDGNCYLSKIG